MSDPPQRVGHSHTHRANAGEHAAGYAHENGEHQAYGQHRFRQKQRRQQSVERNADHWNCCPGEQQAKQSPKEGNHHRFHKNQEEDGTIGYSDGFQHRQFAGTFPDRNSDRVSRNQKKREEDNAPHGQDQELNVSELFGKTGGNADSVSVLVSNEELANFASIAFATRTASSGLSSFRMYHPAVLFTIAGTFSSKFFH